MRTFLTIVLTGLLMGLPALAATRTESMNRYIPPGSKVTENFSTTATNIEGRPVTMRTVVFMVREAPESLATFYQLRIPGAHVSESAQGSVRTILVASPNPVSGLTPRPQGQSPPRVQASVQVLGGGFEKVVLHRTD